MCGPDAARPRNDISGLEPGKRMEYKLPTVTLFTRVRSLGIFWICGMFLSAAQLYCTSVRPQGDTNAGSASEASGPKSKKSNEQPTVKLEIKVKGDNGKPVADASVY